jgi:peptidoglycan/LPS O-acetylase OafA/YrhL
MATDGSTYNSKWEAEDANARLEGSLPEVEAVETKSLKEPTIFQRIVGTLILGGMTVFLVWATIALPIQAYEGKLHFKHEWMWVAAPFIWFFLAGGALQCGASFFATITGREVGEDKVFDWWTEKVGCGILTVVAWAIGIGLAYFVASKFFEGVSKGTAIIIILLAGILIALSQNNSSRR